MTKAMNSLNEHWMKIVSGIVMVGLLFLISLPYQKAVKAQEEAQAAATKIVVVDSAMQQIGRDVSEIKASALRMEDAVSKLVVRAAEVDKDLEFAKVRHSELSKRVDKLEDK